VVSVGGNDLLLTRYGDLELSSDAIARLALVLEDLGEEQLAYRLDRAAEQGDAELVLELAYLFAEGRLGDVKLGCGPGDMGVARYRFEVAQMSQFHDRSPSRTGDH